MDAVAVTMRRLAVEFARELVKHRLLVRAVLWPFSLQPAFWIRTYLVVEFTAGKYGGAAGLVCAAAEAVRL